MTLAQGLFYLMSFIAVGSALFVAGTKNLVRAIFLFFITLFALAGLYVLALAGLYVLALADFVAITQVVIYVGGILVLILFAFMLSGRETLNTLGQQGGGFISIRKLPALLLAALFFIVLVNMITAANADHLVWIKKAVQFKNDIQSNAAITENIGVNLMTRYLLPFEAISVLLMIALIGAAHLSRKERSV